MLCVLSWKHKTLFSNIENFNCETFLRKLPSNVQSHLSNRKNAVMIFISLSVTIALEILIISHFILIDKDLITSESETSQHISPLI